jgi:hypothetical protein
MRFLCSQGREQRPAVGPRRGPGALRAAVAGIIVLGFLLAAAPTFAAQAPAGDEVVELRGTDPEGDVAVTGPAAPIDSSTYDHVDLLAFWISNEQLETIDIGFQLKALDPGNADPSPFGNRDVGVRFEIGAKSYLVGIVNNCGGSYGFRATSPGSQSVYCGFDPAIDTAAGTVTLTLPREILVNETQFPFGPGVPLRNVHAAGFASNSPITASGGTSTAQDRAPDDGFAGDYVSVLGNLRGAGGLELFAAEPVRTSNGESTTLVFPMLLNNSNTFEVNALLTVANVPDGWNVRVPARAVVPAQGVVRFPVILSMEFQHDHGELATFDVRAEQSGDPSRWATARLGVFWLDTPQPAGHHDRLWLHSGGGWSSTGFQFPLPYECRTVGLWMNPLEEEPAGRATDVEVPGCAFTDGPTYATQQTVEWAAALSPELQIGLDFDLARDVQFSVAIRSRLPAQSAVLEFELLHCSPTGEPNGDFGMSFCQGAWTTLAKGRTAPRAVSAESKNTYELTMNPEPAADFLPYEKESQLWLILRLITDRPQTPPNRGAAEYSPMLDPKSAVLTLPLIEYHDPVDQAFAAVGSVSLKALSPFEKPANPGQTKRYDFLLSNHAKEAQTIRLVTEGHNAAWARVAGNAERKLVAGASENVTLLVEVPFDAAGGERAELFLVAESKSDPNVVSLARLRTAVVDPSERIIPEDETVGSIVDGGTTPMPSMVLLLGCLVAAIVVRRRF